MIRFANHTNLKKLNMPKKEIDKTGGRLKERGSRVITYMWNADACETEKYQINFKEDTTNTYCFASR